MKRAATEQTSNRVYVGKLPHLSGLYAHLDHIFQTSGNNGKPNIAHIGKHTDLDIELFDLSKIILARISK